MARLSPFKIAAPLLALMQVASVLNVTPLVPLDAFIDNASRCRHHDAGMHTATCTHSINPRILQDNFGYARSLCQLQLRVGCQIYQSICVK